MGSPSSDGLVDGRGECERRTVRVREIAETDAGTWLPRKVHALAEAGRGIES